MSQIHWHEGLFLQPQHLQRLQRNTLTSIWTERGYSMSFSYGVIEARLARDDLADQRIRFDKLHIAMRDGTIFRFPEDAVLPTLDIRKDFQERPSGFYVGLALPVWHPKAANTIDSSKPGGQHDRLIYQVSESEVTDENTGENPQFVQFRKLNGKLMVQDHEHSDMQFLPLIKVIRQVSDITAGLPRTDPLFVPPSLLLSSAQVIFQLVRDLSSQVCSTRDQIAKSLAGANLDLRQLQGSQFEFLGRLRCLARSAALLPSLIDDSPYVAGCAGRVPLFDVYLALRDLLAELTALYPGKLVEDPLPYDHDDPYPPFADLDLKIRSLMGSMVKVRYRKIDFHLDENLFVGELTPAFFQNATGFYLCVESPMDPTALVRLAVNPDKFKLIPVSYGMRALRGLVLREERNPPLELPVNTKQYFFRVVTEDSGEIWNHFIMEPEGLVHLDAPELNRFRISLYATIPGES